VLDDSVITVVGAEQRKHPRYLVHLSVRYGTAADFVADYVENLSLGGLFIAGARDLHLNQRVAVSVELPDQGTWQVVGKVVFVLSREAAAAAGRKPGAGLEILKKPPGYDDALLGYLLRLGRRRDHAVIAADIPGIDAITAAGYRLLPLCMPAELVTLLADPAKAVIAVVVPPSLAPAYQDAAGERLFTAVTPDAVHEIVGRIDSLL
jgi:Tfp pilus assembly protein PilZ